MKDLLHAKQRVEAILERYPEARNDDRMLMRLYYRLFCGFSLPLEFLSPEVPGPETLRRARQLIQESGKYLPTKETIAKRRRRAIEFRQAAGE